MNTYANREKAMFKGYFEMASMVASFHGTQIVPLHPETTKIHVLKGNIDVMWFCDPGCESIVIIRDKGKTVYLAEYVEASLEYPEPYVLTHICDSGFWEVDLYEYYNVATYETALDRIDPDSLAPRQLSCQ